MIQKNKNKNNWNDFNEFIQIANKYCNWLVLRNFEFLPNNFFGNDKDVDILCDDINLFVDIMKLRKRSWGISSYETLIDNKIVPLDVRFLGDGYYDKLWQYKMLKNKIYTSNNVPRMNDIDYFYSLIYHSKIQKLEVKEAYKERLHKLSGTLKIDNYYANKILDDKYISNLLGDFMQRNYYVYSHPIDVNVLKNDKFFAHLSLYVKNDIECSVPLEVVISKFIPNKILKLIPKRVKNLIKKFMQYDL